MGRADWRFTETPYKSVNYKRFVSCLTVTP